MHYLKTILLVVCVLLAPGVHVSPASALGVLTVGANPLDTNPDALGSKRDFHCVGDNVADDTACLQLFFSDITGKLKVLEHGNYKTTSAITLPASGTHVVGVGSGGDFHSIIRPSNSAAFLFSGVHHSLIENIMIWPQGASPPATLITFTSGNYSLTFNNIRIHYDTADVPTTQVMLFTKGSDTNNNIVFDKLVMRVDGGSSFATGIKFDNDFGSATFINPNIEHAGTCIKWEGGKVTLVGIYTESCGVHTIHMEPSSDANAALSLTGGLISAPGSSVALAIKNGSKNVNITGTWVTPPGSGYQAFIYGSTGSANVNVNLANLDNSKIGGTIDPKIHRFSGVNRPLPPFKSVSINVTTGVLAAGNITGAQWVRLITTNATPGNQQVRAAATMVADIPNCLPGDEYLLEIANTGADTLTLTTNTGVTLTGIMTVETNTVRTFKVTINSLTTMTILDVGSDLTTGSASTLQEAFVGDKEITGANSLANAMRIGDGVTPWCIYTDATAGPIIKPCTDANSTTRIETNKTWSLFDVEGDAAIETVDPDAASQLGKYTYGAAYRPLKSVWFGAGSLSTDGTQCAAPAEVTINSGPKLWTIICTDNDASTIHGSIKMPDSWDAGTVTFEHVYIQTAADTSALNGDIAAQCYGNGEAVGSTWNEVALDDAAVTGSNKNDFTTSAAVTPAGTCAAGDMLYFRYQLDATGTTTAVATLHHVGFKMEYGITSRSD